MEEAFVQVQALREGSQVPASINFFKAESCSGSLTKQIMSSFMLSLCCVFAYP